MLLLLNFSFLGETKKVAIKPNISQKMKPNLKTRASYLEIFFLMKASYRIDFFGIIPSSGSFYNKGFISMFLFTSLRELTRASTVIGQWKIGDRSLEDDKSKISRRQEKTSNRQRQGIVHTRNSTLILLFLLLFLISHERWRLFHRRTLKSVNQFAR